MVGQPRLYGDWVKKKIRTHRDLLAYGKAFAAAMRIFELSRQFPAEERYALTDQIRRSLGLCAQIWLKPGANAATKRRLLANCLMRRAKRRKRKGGWNSPSSVIPWIGMKR